jgi:hypothetical protein
MGEPYDCQPEYQDTSKQTNMEFSGHIFKVTDAKGQLSSSLGNDS